MNRPLTLLAASACASLAVSAACFAAPAASIAITNEGSTGPIRLALPDCHGPTADTLVALQLAGFKLGGERLD